MTRPLIPYLLATHKLMQKTWFHHYTQTQVLPKTAKTSGDFCKRQHNMLTQKSHQLELPNSPTLDTCPPHTPRALKARPRHFHCQEGAGWGLPPRAVLSWTDSAMPMRAQPCSQHSAEHRHRLLAGSSPRPRYTSFCPRAPFRAVLGGSVSKSQKLHRGRQPYRGEG